MLHFAPKLSLATKPWGGTCPGGVWSGPPPALARRGFPPPTRGGWAGGGASRPHYTPVGPQRTAPPARISPCGPSAARRRARGDRAATFTDPARRGDASLTVGTELHGFRFAHDTAGIAGGRVSSAARRRAGSGLAAACNAAARRGDASPTGGVDRAGCRVAHDAAGIAARRAK